jgi:hypothetical protein
MKTTTTKLLLALAALLVTSPLALAQADGEQKKGEQPSPAPARSFKSKILEVRHRDPQMLANAVSELGSGAGGSRIVANQEFKTIAVRDFPENIAVIEEALKRLDVPAPAPISLEVNLHIIAATRDGAEKSAFPAGLEAIRNQLQSTLKYGGYRYITTFFNRVNDGGTIDSRGAAEAIFPVPQNANNAPSFYTYRFNRIRLASDPSGKEAIQIGDFRFNLQLPLPTAGGGVQYTDVGLTTPLSLREGETVVVGTTTAGKADEAIIAAVSVRKAR